MTKQIIILGAGESGTGAALLAKAKGYDVFVSDFGQIKQENIDRLTDAGIRFEQGKHTEDKVLTADIVIKSPGISPAIPLVRLIMEKGIPVIDELEFASQFTKGKIIAITGTNGKTTTTLLTYHLLKESGLSVGLGGNVGKSMAAQLLDTDYDWWVLEVSSFQIDGFIHFKPHIAVLLNITPDHLDRYDKKIQNYIDAKFALFKNQGIEDYAILYNDKGFIDEELQKRNLKSKIYRLSFDDVPALGAYANKDGIIIKHKKDSTAYTSDLLTIKGKHNQINAMASILSSKITGLKSEKISENLPKFKNVPHRLEPVGSIHGVEFINDSKATNVDAVYYALDAYTRPIIWIVGGVDKGNDYEKLEPVNSNVKAIICLGKDNKKIKAFYEGKFPIIEETESMQEAVRMGYHLAKDREIVLLSPACASFDLFKNYEDRGNQFRLAVQLLQREVELKKLSQ
ncbi:UDP-N-acetylmuramoyl-L-alanine--D-glutamate ligase [Marivirga sp. S37H4]|uniref:UDP-N-acetylmuramoylalanine--D-glutamate ligase n=1 Tax=Marivirga aurantiaca TaxID=2802615 RepID=A0A935CB95_9BACT|nr:UDP-N-acetylmuramoyl-L-alanine--D-glutamate ligase [Marivirga aurantiaca]MBK6266964.1 UDP-N-acetylmuramoyl-L-alanine--D-glutamate ligase [Marivirga aurantiaca]